MNKKVIFVSGAGSGLGLSLVKSLANNGHIVNAGMRNPDAFSSILQDKKRFHNVIVMYIDVTDYFAVSKAFSAVLTRGTDIDILVNNAACAVVGAVENVPLNEVRHVFEVNFFGALRGIQALLPSMRE